MFFTCLPPELLLDIFEQAAGNLPSRTDEQARSRSATLCCLALVHSSFRSIAQALLPKEVTWDFSNPQGSLRQTLAQAPFLAAKSEHFHLIDTDPLRDPRRSEYRNLWVLQGWTSLVTLDILGCEHNPIAVDFLGLDGFVRKS